MYKRCIIASFYGNLVNSIFYSLRDNPASFFAIFFKYIAYRARSASIL